MDGLLAAKLLLTPILIGGISLVARRFGPRAGGTLAGLPWTSATLSVFLALESGPAFAQRAAVSTAAAVPAVVTFCFAYAFAARLGPLVSVGAGLAAFMAVVTLTARWAPEVILAFFVALLALSLGLFAFPRGRVAAIRPPPPGWDIPARMAAATALVLLLTTFARVLGPAWTGSLSPFPVFASVLAVFTHRHDGPDAAIDLLKGVMIGLMSFATFFVVVGSLLPDAALLPTYAVAIGAALATNLVAWGLWLRARSRAAKGPPSVDTELASGK